MASKLYGFNATLIIFLYCIVLYCIDVASKLYGFNATLIIFLFVLYCKQKLDEVEEDERRSRREGVGQKSGRPLRATRRGC